MFFTSSYTRAWEGCYGKSSFYFAQRFWGGEAAGGNGRAAQIADDARAVSLGAGAGKQEYVQNGAWKFVIYVN